MEPNNALVRFNSTDDLKAMLSKQYAVQIQNFFGDRDKALRFLSSVVTSVQRTPKIMDCKPDTILNSFMRMAELRLMPSDVSGEAYVIPYNDEAQFQLGYQGIVTLFYRSGVKSIAAEIVYQNDKFSYKNGVISHEPDVFSDERGEAIGAFVIIDLQSGGRVHKVMSKKRIMEIGSRFSKTYKTKFTPWKVENDPELWMWKKTVLKQAAKLVPKNDALMQAIAEDNKESNVADRAEKARAEASSLKIGAHIKMPVPKTQTPTEDPAKDSKADSGEKQHDPECELNNGGKICTCIPTINVEE